MHDLTDIYNLSKSIFSMKNGIEKLKKTEQLLIDKYNFYMDQLKVLKFGDSLSVEMQSELNNIINSTMYSIMDNRDQMLDFEENI